MGEKSSNMPIPEQWTFKDTGVAESFNQHVRGQLPWYDLVLSSLKLLATHYLPSSDGVMYDIGASTGNFYLAMRDVLETRGTEYRAVEVSREMAAKWQGDPEALAIEDAMTHPYKPFDVAVLNLTMMFLPASERAAWFRRLRGQCKPGGAILVVDRVLTETPETLLIERLRWQQKIDTGETYTDIVKKEMSLIGIQRPIDPKILEPAFCWFTLGSFAGWICPVAEAEPAG